MYLSKKLIVELENELLVNLERAAAIKRLLDLAKESPDPVELVTPEAPVEEKPDGDTVRDHVPPPPVLVKITPGPFGK